MGTLTKNERDGLEDVFLSIQSNTTRYKKLINSSFLGLQSGLLFILKRVNSSLKNSKITHFITFLGKQKKNLSK